jgi:hypothetical protein
VKDTVKQQNGTHDNKDGANYPPGQLNPDEHTDHCHNHVQLCLRARTVVNDLKIQYPVPDADNREKYQHIVNNTQETVLGPIQQKHKNIGYDNVYPPVVLGGGRL